MEYLYKNKQFLGVSVDTDFTDMTNVSDLFTDNGYAHLLDASYAPLYQAVFTSCTRELAYCYFYFFSNETYDDLDQDKILRGIFFNNFQKGVNKYPFLNDFLTKKASLITSFGTSGTTTTTTSSVIGARTNTTKQNDTPQSGNIDVSSNTYLSSIAKSDSASATDTGSVNQTLSNVDSARLLETLNKEINTQLEGFIAILLSNCENI